MRMTPLFCAAFLIPAMLLGNDEYTRLREAMVRQIEQETAADSSILNQKALDKRVLDAMRKVPRHLFVPENQQPYAYENRPLAIGHGQTISQPYVVALMTDLLKLKPTDRVLEIGTGSGYQGAILAELVSEVYTIEIIGALASLVKERFQRLGYSKIRTRHGDGYYGWEPSAVFDAIVVTAAADHVPPPLIKQLKPGGRMVIPVGGKFTVQQLVVVDKDAGGKTTLRQILPVQFVPLTRGG